MSLWFFTGGVRSGKSDLAVKTASKLAERQETDVTFVATGVAVDDDFAARIERHRRDRPASWSVTEEPVELAMALRTIDDPSVVIVDCLTLWVSNLMARDLEVAIESMTRDAVDAAVSRAGDTIVVTNEVGSGVHPTSELGRRYAEALGRTNSSFARASDQAFLIVAGLGLPLEDPSLRLLR